MPNKKFFLPIVALFSVAALASCGPKEEPRDPEIEKIYNAYRANAEGKGESVLSYEEWLASIKGEKGEPGVQGPQGPKGDKGDQGDQGPAGQDGQDGKDGVNGQNGQDGKDGKDGQNGLNGKDGQNGKDGEDGQDGLNGKDGQNGQDGKDGKDGQDGEDGEDGKSAFEIYCAAHPEYKGDEAQWMDDLVNGRLGNHEKVSVMYLTGFYDPDFNPDITDDVEPSCVKVEGAVDLEDEKGFKLELEAGKLAGRPGDPSIVGYDFEGWYSLGFKADGSAFYEPFNFSQTPVSGDMILIAKYAAKSFDVEIVCGDEESYHISLKYGEVPAPKLPAEVVAKHGDRFYEGLYADSTFKYKVDLNEPYKQASDFTVYAHYIDFVADGDYMAEGGYDGDYNYYMFKATVNDSSISLHEVQFDEDYDEFSFDHVDELGYLVFNSTKGSGKNLIAALNGSLFNFLITKAKGSTPYYTEITSENYYGYPGDFYGTKFSRDSAMMGVSAYVPNTKFESDVSEITLFPGDYVGSSLFSHISFTENASIQSFTIEPAVGSEDYFSGEGGYMVTTDKIGDASVTLRDYDGNSLSMTIHNVEKTYISAIDITGEGIQDGEVTLELGQTLQLAASYSMEGVNQDPIIKWSTSSSSKVSVNASTGLITAKAAGTATITVKDDAKPAPKVSKTLTVNVVLPAIPEKMIGAWQALGYDEWSGCDMPIDISVSESAADVTLNAGDGKYNYSAAFKSVADGVYSFQSSEYSDPIKLSLKVDGDDVYLVSMSGSYFEYGDWSIEGNQQLIEVQTYALSIDSELSNGSIQLLSPSAEGQVPAGKEVAFVANPSEGYRVSSISVNGGAVEVKDKWDSSRYEYVKVFNMPAGDAVISASFELIVSHNVSKVSGLEGGKVVITGDASGGSAEVGSTVSFSATADEGYALKSVFIVEHPEVEIKWVEGFPKGHYEFEMPDFDVQISAEFEESTPAPAGDWPTEKIKAVCYGQEVPAPSVFTSAEVTTETKSSLVITVTGADFTTYCQELKDAGLHVDSSGANAKYVYDDAYDRCFDLNKLADGSFTLTFTIW